MIGSIDPESVKKAVPILVTYLGNAEWWMLIIREAAKENMEIAIDLTVAEGMGVNPEVWVRDAAIGALGDIGEKNPEMMKDTISMIISCLQRPEPYTRKRAVVALGQIGKNNRSYVESAIPTLVKVAEKDPDEKVRLETKRVLEIIKLQQHMSEKRSF